MSEQANVHNIEAISEMRSALLRFGDEVKQALLAAAQELQRTEEWLRERLNWWQREVERREEIARRAYRAWEACRSNLICDENGRCWPPPCTRENQQYEEAVRFLRAGQAELANVQQWAKRVQQAAADYQVEARRLTNLASDGVPQAAAYLSSVADRLYAYTATAAPTANISTSGTSGQTVNSLEAVGELVAGLGAAPLLATLAGLGVPTENANPLTSPPVSHSVEDVQQRVEELRREKQASEQAELEEIRRQQANTPQPDLSNPPPTPTPPPGWMPGGPEGERSPNPDVGVERRG